MPVDAEIPGFKKFLEAIDNHIGGESLRIEMVAMYDGNWGVVVGTDHGPAIFMVRDDGRIVTPTLISWHECGEYVPVIRAALDRWERREKENPDV